MSNKTIWIINQYAGSPLHGMEFRHYYLAKELDRLGCKVNIISGTFSHLYKKTPSATEEFTIEDIDGIKYCWIKVPPYSGTGSLGRIRNMMAFSRKLKNIPVEKLFKPDAIIVSSPSLFPVKAAKKFCDYFHAKMIFEVRDIWPLTLCELGGISRWHPLIRYMRHFEKFGYRKADKVVSLLPGAKEHFVRSGMKPEKFAWIPNGIFIDDKKVDLPEPEILPELKKISSGKFIVGYAGTIGVSNALENFIRASILLKENSRIHFVMVGDGGEKEKLMKMAGNNNNISFFPSVHKEQVQMVLQSFNVCYIGWHRQSLYRFGISANKLFEYMYAGRPIIHAVDAYNDPVKENNCGWSIQPDDSEELASIISKVESFPPTDLDILGENGRKAVKGEYTYSILAKSFLELI